MATAAQIAALRLMIAQPDDVAPYTDAVLGAAIDAAGNLDAVAYDIWIQKAASASALVDISEGGSSRKMGDLQEQYLAMAKVYGDRLPTGGTDVGRRTRVSRLTR
jgi:hypothetical protein